MVKTCVRIAESLWGKSPSCPANTTGLRREDYLTRWLQLLWKNVISLLNPCRHKPTIEARVSYTFQLIKPLENS